MRIKSIEDGKPKENCLCLVWNTRHYLKAEKAFYWADSEVFVPDEPRNIHLALDVTHYLEIPEVLEEDGISED
jgi:hypothetical protein